MGFAIEKMFPISLLKLSVEFVRQETQINGPQTLINSLYYTQLCVGNAHNFNSTEISLNIIYIYAYIYIYIKFKYLL